MEVINRIVESIQSQPGLVDQKITFNLEKCMRALKKQVIDVIVMPTLQYILKSNDCKEKLDSLVERVELELRALEIGILQRILIRQNEHEQPQVNAHCADAASIGSVPHSFAVDPKKPKPAQVTRVGSVDSRDVHAPLESYCGVDLKKPQPAQVTQNGSVDSRDVHAPLEPYCGADLKKPKPSQVSYIYRERY